MRCRCSTRESLEIRGRISINQMISGVGRWGWVIQNKTGNAVKLDRLDGGWRETKTLDCRQTF